VQIGESAGAECKAALQETTKLVEQRLQSNGKALKTLFGAAEVQYFFPCSNSLICAQNMGLA